MQISELTISESGRLCPSTIMEAFMNRRQLMTPAGMASLAPETIGFHVCVPRGMRFVVVST